MCIVRPCKFDYSENRNLIYKLRKAYPFAEFSVIGRSLAGRAIFSLSVGTGETKVLYLGGINGQEWLTSLVLFRFFERLCEAYNTNGTICALKMPSCLEGRKITIVPCVNPDGIEIAQYGASSANAYSYAVENISHGLYSEWNANARGVDLARNFDFDWEKLRENGVTCPAPQGFGGTMPESEPETKAVMKLCRASDFHHAFDLRACGEEIYWSDNNISRKQSLMMAKVLRSASGYALVSDEGITPVTGFTNRFVDEMHRPAFSMLIGSGKNPLPVSILDPVYEQLEEALVLGAIL